MRRPPFQTRTFRLVGIDQRARLMALIENLPIDDAKPLEVVIREEKKARKNDWFGLNLAGAKGKTMDQVLDVRGVGGRAARIREIRAMAGRAMLDGPHDYRASELEGPLLDLAVAKALGLPAVIHKVDNAIAPFFECCVLAEDGRLKYQYTPSRGWCQGGPVVEDNCISITHRGSNRWAADAPGGWLMEAEAPLLAAMRALVAWRLGDTVRM